MFKILSAAAIVASIAASPALAAEKKSYDELFAEAVTDEFTAQIAGTYPARGEILVKVANGNQFALPVADTASLSEWKENDVITVTMSIGAVTDISDAEVTEPTVTYDVMSDDLTGAPDDTVVRTVTYSLPAAEVTVTETDVTFVGPEGNSVTVPFVDGVSVKPIKGEFATITYYDAVSVDLSE